MGDIILHSRTADSYFSTIWRNYLSVTSNILPKIFSLFCILMKISWDIETNPGPTDISQDNTNTSISLCHLNARSLKAKTQGTNIIMELIRHDLSKKFNIITVSETWLSDTDSLNDFMINGFQQPFVLNRPTRAGGVLCWVKNNIAAKRRQDLENNQTEALWLEVRTCNNKFLLCTAYRPPNPSRFLRPLASVHGPCSTK